MYLPFAVISLYAFTMRANWVTQVFVYLVLAAATVAIVGLYGEWPNYHTWLVMGGAESIVIALGLIGRKHIERDSSNEPAMSLRFSLSQTFLVTAGIALLLAPLMSLNWAAFTYRKLIFVLDGLILGFIALAAANATRKAGFNRSLFLIPVSVSFGIALLVARDCWLYDNRYWGLGNLSWHTEVLVMHAIGICICTGAYRIARAVKIAVEF